MEKGDLEAALLLLQKAQTICETHAEDMTTLLADIYFSLSVATGEMHNLLEVLDYGKKQLEFRILAERDLIEPTGDIGMAESRLALAYIMNDQFKQALIHCDIALGLYNWELGSSNRKWWPHFPLIHKAWSLSGLNRDSEAIEMLQETVRWREAKYGKNDTESFK